MTWIEPGFQPAHPSFWKVGFPGQFKRVHSYAAFRNLGILGEFLLAPISAVARR